MVSHTDRKLFPVLGTPGLGPYDAVVEKVADAARPVCGRPMSEHFIDHSTPQTILHCPVALSRLAQLPHGRSPVAASIARIHGSAEFDNDGGYLVLSLRAMLNTFGDHK